MKGMFIIYDQELQNELDFILRSNNIQHFTRFDAIRGRGGSGLKLGDPVGPGLNRVYWIAISDAEIGKLLKELKEFKNLKLKNKGIQIFVLPIETSL